MTISRQIYANNAKTTLVSAVTPSDTTIQVTDGSRFPSPTAGEFFLVTIESGANIEIVKVGGRTSNTFTNCVRAQEGTVAANFSAGARIDNRVTKGTLDAFARKVDRVDEVNSVDLLDTPVNSNSNSYICHSNDDNGNPILAYKDNTSWGFSTHRITSVSGSATATTSKTSITSTDIATKIGTVVGGRYIIQFLTGSNAGLARMVISGGLNTVSWSTALPNNVVLGDQFEIYKSDSSIINDLLASSDDGLIYAILLND